MEQSKEKRKQFYNQLHSLAQGSEINNIYHEDAEIYASHPINEISGLKDINKLWESLRNSFPDIERRDSIFVLGTNFPDERSLVNIEGIELVASMCHYQGTFENDLFGIPASKKVVYLRSCEVHQFLNDKIIKSYIIFDLLNLMKQVGLSPISPSLGTDFFWPGPATADGVRIDGNNNTQTSNSFEVVMKMHKALGEYDGKDIESMKHSQYWSKNFLWYGPSGI